MGLETLRTQTKTQHLDLEKRLNLFEKIQNKDQYLQHLQNYYTWLAPIEKSLDDYAKELPIHWEQRKRTHLLAQDIQALGGSLAPEENLVAQTKCSSLAEALGILYVLEGSTLGGQIICRHFAALLDIQPSTGLAFYNGRGPQTGPMWKGFLQILEANMESHPAALDQTCRAACSTFESIGNALCTH